MEIKEYTVGDLFEIKPTKHIKKENIIGPGNILVITGGETNYGVSGYYKLDKEYVLEKGNCLTFCRTSGFVAYRNTDFIGLDSVASLRHKMLTENIGLYIAQVLQKNDSYSFGRKRLTENVKSEKIKLPSIVNEDGTYSPDWKYMEEYIKNIKKHVVNKIYNIFNDN